MNEYMNRYDTLQKSLVYEFGIGSGGIGDFLKFFMYALNLCIKHNIRLYYLVNIIPLEKYIKLKNPNMYISKDATVNQTCMSIDSVEDIGSITPNECAIVFISPCAFYTSFTFEDIVDVDMHDVFYFSDEVLQNVKNIMPQCVSNTKYTSIHLRLGDKFLETDKSFVIVTEDVRDYSEETLFKFIQENSDKQLLFFCDNNEYKLNVKGIFDWVVITNSKIGHTSLENTTEEQVLDAITEFYIMTNSDEIVCASSSGFSKMASMFRNIPIRFL